MARTRYGKTFRTRRGRYGRYKYVNGRRVGFVSSKRRTRRTSKLNKSYSGVYFASSRKYYPNRNRRY